MSNENYTVEELCSTVFHLSRYAGCMETEKTITIPDEQELFHMILDWAREFKTSFDPASGKDYQSELESRGTKWLLETFPYNPELDIQRLAIIDYIQFEDETSEIWPWAVSAEELLQSDLRGVEKIVHFENGDHFDTDELYFAINHIFGINPILLRPQSTEGMTGPTM